MDGAPNKQENANTAQSRLEIELPPPIPAGRKVSAIKEPPVAEEITSSPQRHSEPPPHPDSPANPSNSQNRHSAPSSNSGDGAFSIDSPEMVEKLGVLSTLAKKRGYVMFDDLNTVFPDNINEPDEMQAIFYRLKEMGIDIIDPSQVSSYKNAQAQSNDKPTSSPAGSKTPPASDGPNGCLIFFVISIIGIGIVGLIASLSSNVQPTQTTTQTAYSTTSQDATNSQSALAPQSTPAPTPTPLPPHVILNANGNWEPAPGYQWASDGPNDLRVIPKVTPTPTPTPLPPHVVLNANGKREAAPGYQWANDDPNDLRVIPKVTPTPTPTPLPPHVVLNANGKREPAPGYEWANDDPNDLRVIPKVIQTPTPIPLSYYRCIVVNLPPGDFLNVRNEANSDAQILARLQPGTEVFWIPGGSKTVGGYRWVRILIGDSEGWIHANFLHLLPDSTQRMGVSLIPFSWEGKSYQIRQEQYAPIEKLAARLNFLKTRCAQIKTASVKKAEWERLSHEFDSGNRELKSLIQDAKVP